MSLDQYVVKTPSCLPTSFGKESHTSMIHGGMNSRDASSKYIHMQNQVSLGAGKIVNSKMRFKDWL